jgi:hypothetical protein
VCGTVKFFIDCSYLKNKQATWPLLSLCNMAAAGLLRPEQFIVPLALLELSMIAYHQIADC